MKSKTKKYVLINGLIIAVIAVVVVLAIAAPKPSGHGAMGPGGGPGKGGRPGMMDASGDGAASSVKTATVTRGTLQDYIQINGDVEADTKVEVYPDIGGKLAKLYINLGSTVKKGQLIAEIDPSKPGNIYANSPVYAPISGTITSLPLRAGTTVTTSSTLVIIGSIDDLQINTSIPERYVSVLKIGLKADVTLEAYPDVIFHARVSRISPVVDSTSRTKQIYLAFNEFDSRINAGMFAKIKLNTTTYENVLALSEEAIVTNYDEKYVFVVQDNNIAVKRSIEQGVSVDGLTQIVSGLNDGEKVVVQGMSALSDGAKVKEITGVGVKK